MGRARHDHRSRRYESLTEKLAERFHTSEELLQQLNLDINLNALRAGASLHVPNVERQRVETLIVSDGGRYLHAVDADDRIIFHFPATLGSAYSPSPTGRVPHHRHRARPDLALPAGAARGRRQRRAVRRAAARAERRRRHGMDAAVPAALRHTRHGRPGTIGYATSSGCVRLTNWDVEFLARFVEAGVRVRFRDVE